jgi:histidine ammonia-lyase
MINLGQHPAEYDEFKKIVIDGEPVEISEIALNRVKHSYEFLDNFCKGKIIYGINTGFGPMAPYRINVRHQKELQYNLVRSHSSGTGDVLPPVYLRAILTARLNTLLQGYSGVHESIIIQFKEYINRGIYPVVFTHGGVGASGDLVQLAHVALGLIGEGEVIYKNERRHAEEVLNLENLKPVELKLREGIGVMNGTAAMTGIGMVNLHYARKIVKLSVLASCMINELVQSFSDHFSAELNEAKKHKGQHEIAARMRHILHDSHLLRTRSEHLYDNIPEMDIVADKVQEYYSIRCVPQILGAVEDTLNYSEKVLVDEINSANDNPIIDMINQNVYHGGNFHGDYVAFEMDKMRIAITKVSMLAERQLNYLMNHKLNNILPPFANLGRLGLNFGMQGVQFTAVSTTAENQALSTPMYIHSIPNNNDNQDIVSMGANSAWLTKRVIDNTFEVLSIHVMSLCQAVDHLQCAEKMSTTTRKFYDGVRGLFPVFSDDKPKYRAIAELTEYFKNGQPEPF